jgi:hypothetical protein
MTGGGTRQPGFSSEMLRDNRHALTKIGDVCCPSTVTVPTNSMCAASEGGRTVSNVYA